MSVSIDRRHMICYNKPAEGPHQQKSFTGLNSKVFFLCNSLSWILMVQLNLPSVVCKRPDSVWPRHGVLGFGTIYSAATLGNSLIYFLPHILRSQQKYFNEGSKFKLKIVNFLYNLSKMTMTTIFRKSQISSDFYSNILTIWEHEEIRQFKN